MRMAELAHMNRQAVAAGMSAAIAHELNQPLGAILNNTETAEVILKSDNPNLAELRSIVADIRTDDWRASEIIRRLRLLISKNTADFKPLDLNDVVRDAIGITSIQARTHGIEIHQNLAAGRLPVFGDTIQLQQVVVNLALNGIDAVKDQPKARKDVIVQTTSVDDRTIELSISDSGLGIDANKLDGIFKPFFSTKSAGMGMGLAIAQMIIETHGGKIWAENRSGGGAVFRVRLENVRQH